MALGYSYIDSSIPTEVPPPKANGGLYTGIQAKNDWRNYPVKPEPHILAENLKSAKPPPGAEKQPMSTERPGNNHVTLPYHKKLENDQYNINCII
jgi:hypothetical protein